MGLLRRRWLQMLLSGLVLLFLVERTLIATSSQNYVPSVLLLGSPELLVKQSRSSTDAWQEGSKSCRSGLKMRPQIAPKLLQARYKQLLDGGSLLATNLDHQKLGRARIPDGGSG